MKKPYLLQDIATQVQGELVLNMPAAQAFSTLLIDSRKLADASSSLFFAMDGNVLSGHNYIPELIEKGVTNFVVNDPAKITATANFLIVKDVKNALQKIAAFHRKQFAIPVIGITGSNGKTIVKEWLYQLLHEKYTIVKSPKSYNSQIGVPLSVWQIDENDNLGIFEAGISESGEMEKLETIIQPTIGVFTNVGEAHSEGFINESHKSKEKLKLFTKSEVLVYCKDHGELNNAITSLTHILHTNNAESKFKTFCWSQFADADVRVNSILQQKGKSFISCVYQEKEIDFEIPFTDKASVENALHCFCVLLLLKVNIREIKKRMALLSRLEMRLEMKDGINNCTIINDSYNSDSASIKIALDFLQQQNANLAKTVILSDILQSGKNDFDLYSDVAKMIENTGVKQLFLVGNAISKQKKIFENIPNTSVRFFSNVDEFLSTVEANNFNNELILVKGARKFEFERIAKFLEKKAHNTILEINLNALVNNLKVYQSLLAPSTQIMAMVKAFGYGSGSTEVAKVLQFNRVNYLAVAYADEGIELRKAGIHLPIMVMNVEENSFEGMITYQLEPAIYSVEQLKKIEEVFCNKKRKIEQFQVHIELETGMNRLGFSANEITELIPFIQSKKTIKIASVFSHLAGSEAAELDGFTTEQINQFTSISEKITASFSYKILRHILNSNGITRHSNAQFDMVRLGIGLYGIDGSEKIQKRLQVVSTLKTSISQIKHIKKGETVGYGRIGKAESDRTIATIGIGYADGLPRCLNNGKGYVVINQQKAPIIGNICMDMTMVDITEIPSCNRESEVIVFGENPTVIDVATLANTIPYEILTGVSSRVKRIYFQE